MAFIMLTAFTIIFILYRLLRRSQAELLALQALRDEELDKLDLTLHEEVILFPKIQPEIPPVDELMMEIEKALQNSYLISLLKRLNQFSESRATILMYKTFVHETTLKIRKFNEEVSRTIEGYYGEGSLTGYN
jgi:hypothetical protein